jgi:hypothetical protein
VPGGDPDRRRGDVGLLVVSALLLIPSSPAHVGGGWQIHDIPTRIAFDSKAAALLVLWMTTSTVGVSSGSGGYTLRCHRDLGIVVTRFSLDVRTGG